MILALVVVPGWGVVAPLRGVVLGLRLAPGVGPRYRLLVAVQLLLKGVVF